MGIYAPNVTIEAPTCTPWRFGLLSVSTVIEETDPHIRNGIQYKPMACLAGVEPWDDVCPPDVPDPKTPTDVGDQRVLVEGDPFTIYSYLSCKTTTLEAMFGEVRNAFTLGEPRAVEQEFWLRVLAQPDCTVLNASSLPADALPTLAGIAALESYMADNYGCQATFHADRAVAPYAFNARQLVRNGGALETQLGSRFAAYGASINTGPDGVAPPAGYAWIYATSAVTLRRFPVETYPDSVDQILQRNSNEPVVIAERTYVPSVECACAAVLVCLGCN